MKTFCSANGLLANSPDFFVGRERLAKIREQQLIFSKITIWVGLPLLSYFEDSCQQLTNWHPWSSLLLQYAIW